MTTFVEFEEPFATLSTGETINQTVRVLKEDVIRYQIDRQPRYNSAEDALDDFLVVHWARLIEVP